MMKVNMRELNEVRKFVRKLPKKLDRKVTQTNTLFMKAIRKSARLRAPKDTGELRESIKLLPISKGKNVKKWRLVVDAPHAIFQETGFTPHYFFAGKTFNSSKMMPGVKYYVSKWTPFVEPALQKQLVEFDNKLNNAVNRAIK